MAAWQPLRRREFIRKLRALGFAGPYSGTRHQFMVLHQKRQTIPSNKEYSVPQVRMLVRQVEAILGRAVEADEWSRI